MSCCAARRFWNSRSSSAVIESASAVPAVSSASTPASPASPACATTSRTCARTSRMSFTPWWTPTIAPKTDARKRPLAAKSVSAAGMRGSPRTSNDRVCGGASPTVSRAWYIPGITRYPCASPKNE